MKTTRRSALGLLLGGAGLLAIGVLGSHMLRGMMTGRMMGSASSADMSTYMDLFNRHSELRRTVEEIPGGVRTTTESDAADLVAHLQAHVSSMYGHVNQRAEVTCMSDSLPILFQNARGYKRQLALTSNGVTVTETSSNPALMSAIRAHAQEVSGFIRDGMPAMMRGMMG